MGLSNQALNRYGEMRSALAEKDLAMLDGIALPEVAKRNFVDPMQEKAKQLLANFRPGESTRVISPEASRILRSYPEAAILFVNPRSLDDANTSSVFSFVGQRQIAANIDKLIAAGLITEETKMQDMVKFMSPSVIAKFVPEVANQVHARLRESSSKYEQINEELSASEKQESVRLSRALDEARYRSYANGTGTQASSPETARRLGEREVQKVLGRFSSSDASVEPSSASSLVLPSTGRLAGSTARAAYVEPTPPLASSVEFSSRSTVSAVNNQQSIRPITTRQQITNLPMQASGEVVKTVVTPAHSFWALPEGGGPRIYINISKVKIGQSVTDEDGRMRVTVLGKNQSGAYQYKVEYRDPGNYSLHYKNTATRDFSLGVSQISGVEKTRPIQADRFAAKDSLSVVYKHPVTNFDFLPEGGGYEGIKVSGLKYGESSTNKAGTIKITNLGVANDGYRFKIEFADSTQYSMRSRSGDRGYAFHAVGARLEAGLSNVTQSVEPQLNATDLYKRYTDIYQAASGSDSQCHAQAIASLKGVRVGDDVKATIKSWADSSQSPENKKFFERFLNSLM